ncbi:MAG: hypothetical protein ABSC15_11255 [Terriglobales bacterium]|jgi:hypothetical protein
MIVTIFSSDEPWRDRPGKNKTWASFSETSGLFLNQEDDKFAIMLQVVSPFLKIFILSRHPQK